MALGVFFFCLAKSGFVLLNDNLSSFTFAKKCLIFVSFFSLGNSKRENSIDKPWKMVFYCQNAFSKQPMFSLWQAVCPINQEVVFSCNQKVRSKEINGWWRRISKTTHGKKDPRNMTWGLAGLLMLILFATSLEGPDDRCLILFFQNNDQRISNIWNTLFVSRKQIWEFTVTRCSMYDICGNPGLKFYG